MPAQDRTGPRGEGPRTGRHMGPCGPYLAEPLEDEQLAQRGLGRGGLPWGGGQGRGRGGGQGRGGGGGQGRGRGGGQGRGGGGGDRGSGGRPGRIDTPPRPAETAESEDKKE